jgi:hypothetical protein
MPKAESDTTVIEVEAISQENNKVSVPSSDGLQFDQNDIDIPRLNVIQKTSDIEASTGSLVLDKRHVLLKPSEIGQVIVVSAVKAWKEDIPFDEGKMPRLAATPALAAQLAADSTYPVVEFADIVLLFRQPEGSTDDEAYSYPIGDANYALGKLYVAKDAYRQTYKRLVTFVAVNQSSEVRSRLRNRLWNFQSQLMERGKYSWYVPSLSVSQSETPAEVLEFIEIFNG